MKALLPCIIILLVLACKSIPTVPFNAQVVGVDVRFPSTTGQLLTGRQVMKGKGHVQYFSETASTSVYWFYNWRKTNLMPPAYEPPDSTQFYGIVIFMTGKAAKLDSVRKQFESQFSRPMTQLSVEHINLHDESIYTPTSPVYTLVPSPGARLSLRVGSINKGDYSLLNYEGAYRGKQRSPGTVDNPESLLRIAVSYRLEPDEEERFAIGHGAVIWKDAD